MYFYNHPPPPQSAFRNAEPSQYYGINPSHYEETIHTTRDFWIVAGPSTFGVVMFMLIFLFGKDDAMKEWVKDRWGWVKDRWRKLRVSPRILAPLLPFST